MCDIKDTVKIKLIETYYVIYFILEKKRRNYNQNLFVFVQYFTTNIQYRNFNNYKLTVFNNETAYILYVVHNILNICL